MFGKLFEKLGFAKEPNAVPELLKRMESPEPEKRREALTMLHEFVKENSGGGADGAAIAAAMVRTLADAEYEISLGAEDVLLVLGSTAVQPLIGVLNHKNPAICHSAIVVLKQIGDEEGIQAISNIGISRLIECLGSGDEEIRDSAAGVLGDLGELARPAEDALIEHLDDASSEVRMSVAMVLGELKSEKSVPKLAALLNDEDRFVQKTARESLAQIDSVLAREALESVPE